MLVQHSLLVSGQGDGVVIGYREGTSSRGSLGASSRRRSSRSGASSELNQCRRRRCSCGTTSWTEVRSLYSAKMVAFKAQGKNENHSDLRRPARIGSRS